MADVLMAPPPLPTGPVDGSPSDRVPSAKFATTNMILPPPDLKTIIGKTALHVARSATRQQFEDRLRESRREDPKFSFLNPTDPYYAYYKFRVDRIVAGEDEEEASAATNGATMEVDEPVAPVDEGDEPPPMQYSLELPPLPAFDVDLMKLTALFTAQRGKQFLASLSQKEGRNYQFDFLRPSSALFGLFNRMVEQYKTILLPPKSVLDRVNETCEPEGKWKRLAETRRYAKWERIQREKEKQREDDREAERIAFAEIDWHEFAIVQTIEFTGADMATELPVPMTIQQMESRALAEKRMTAMVMEDTAQEFERVKEAAAAQAAALAVQQQQESESLELQQRRQREAEEQAREEQRARELQAKNLEGAGPMKIRHDYVPKTLVEKAAGKVPHTICQICGQSIPTHEMEEHTRIELLDPRWKSQRDALEKRRSQANELQSGADVAGSLKKLARKRVDLFGAEESEERRKQEEAEELARRREKEKVVWDGHLASKAGTMDKYQVNVNIDEQIAAIHRAKGVVQMDTATIGPGIGPAATPAPIGLPAPPASLPVNPTTLKGEAAYVPPTASTQPQPSSSAIFSLVPGQQQPVVLPPLHYQGLSSSLPFSYTPPPAGSPSRGTPTGTKPTPAVAGTVRSAEEMLEGDPSGGPAHKRPRVGRMPDGSLYPEDTWLSYNPDPVTINIRLPNVSDKPEWKLDGSVIAVPDVPLTAIVSVLRDKLISQIDSKVALSRVRLQMGNTTLTNGKTLASYNVMDGEEITFELRDVKKK
ncbi:hypothetical protein CPB86DRAFT_805903 [Serendipita vermifera]|nr:hypothetical protein CPB86DRAFT_805903 [Serendipita vermifera]